MTMTCWHVESTIVDKSPVSCDYLLTRLLCCTSVHTYYPPTFYLFAFFLFITSTLTCPASSALDRLTAAHYLASFCFQVNNVTMCFRLSQFHISPCHSTHLHHDALNSIAPHCSLTRRALTANRSLVICATRSNHAMLAAAFEKYVWQHFVASCPAHTDIYLQ